MSLTGALAKKERHPATPAPVSPVAVSGGTPYGRSALEGVTSELRATPEGERNDGLNRAAFRVGQLVAGGQLAESEAREALTNAARACGLDEAEIPGTLASGMEAGKKEPRSAPPRESQPAPRPNGNGRRDPFPPKGRFDDDEPEPVPPDEPPQSVVHLPDRNGGEPIDPSASTKPEPHSIDLVPLFTLVGPALDRAERRRKGEETPIPLLFREEAEAHGGGLWPGAHFENAMTGVGKSQKQLQAALAAAKAKIPTAYIGLELDDMQVALRAVGLESGIRWSSLATGRCSEEQIARAREASSALDGLAFYPDFGPPRSYPPSRLFALAEAMRKAHPTGPIQIVLDYLQLVGHDAGSFDRKPELRERVGDAAYAAREVARRYDAAVKVISSVSRAHYGLLGNAAQSAGLVSREIPGRAGRVRTIAQPDALIGLGKESGEVEFSADSVTVLAKWPAPLENGETAIVVAIPKIRWGTPRWFVLAFDGGRFVEFPVQSIEELPEVAKPGKAHDDTMGGLEARLLDTIRRYPNITSKTKLVGRTKGNRSELFELINDLTDLGRIRKGAAGFEVCQEPEGGNR